MAGRQRPIRRVGNRDILPQVLRGTLQRAAADPLAARGLLKRLWMDLKEFGAPRITNVEISTIGGLEHVQVAGSVVRRSPLVVAAVAKLLDCGKIFEFGTFRGETAWLFAHNLPQARVWTLDLGGPEAMGELALEVTDVDEYSREWDRGARFHGTPEALRITQLFGDSATFDFSPYRAAMDLVYVDASHSYSYVRSDTEAALGMLSASGTVIWDDYTHYPGIYRYLDELAPTLDGPIVHLLGTRLALYSRQLPS